MIERERCSKCGMLLVALAGASSHPSDWYCPNDNCPQPDQPEQTYYDIHLTGNQIFRIRATKAQVRQITQQIMSGHAVTLDETVAVLFPLHVIGVLKVDDHHGGKTYAARTTDTGD